MFYSIDTHIIGKSHQISHKVLQDYSQSQVLFDQNHQPYATVAVVCDGHGGEKYFLSHIGSKLACQITTKKLSCFARQFPTYSSLDNVFKNNIIDNLKLSIISQWQKEVEKDWKEQATKIHQEQYQHNLGIPYGTTLLAVLVCKDYYLSCMLGDGCIIKMNQSTDSQDQLDIEPESFENKQVYDEPHGVTDSLCAKNVYDAFHTKLEQCSTTSRAFLLATDGFSEVYNQKILLQKCRDLIEFCATNQDYSDTKNGITNFLQQVANRNDDADDTSLAIVGRNIGQLFKQKQSISTP